MRRSSWSATCSRRLRDLAARGARALDGEDRRGDRIGRQDLDQGGAGAGARPRAAKPTPRRRRSTITGACRCRSPAWRETARYGVFEIGMNHAGEITPLVRLVRPHVAIVTAVEPVHLEFFASRRGHRRRQGGNLPRRRARRRRASSTATIRNSSRLRAARRGSGRDQHRLVRRARPRRCAPHQMRAAAGVLDRRGENPRRAGHLQGRRAGPASGDELARGARRREPRRRRSRPRGTRARASRRRRPAAAPASTLELPDGPALRHRRELQRQSDLDAGGARAARPGADRAGRAAHRGARRHARTRPDRREAAPRPRRRDPRKRRRSRLLRRPADGGAVAGASLGAPRRLCGQRGRARAAGGRRRCAAAMP